MSNQCTFQGFGVAKQKGPSVGYQRAFIVLLCLFVCFSVPRRALRRKAVVANDFAGTLLLGIIALLSMPVDNILPFGWQIHTRT